MEPRRSLRQIRAWQRTHGPRGKGGVFALALASILGLSPISDADALEQPVGDAQAIIETAPVANAGDAADDVAIWRDPANPARSIVIGNDKLGALEVYDMSGALIQRFDGGFYGNVDTRTGMQTGSGSVDIAVTYRLGIRVFGINPTTRQLANITDGATGSIPSPVGGEGICLYRSAATDRIYVFANARDGRIAQFSLTDTDADGLVEGTVVRQWDVGGEVEGCVTDDELGHLYISEEDEAIWKYGAEPTASTDPASRVAVDRPIAAGGHFRPDAEGLTLVYLADGGGYLIASSQAGSNTLNSFLVYDRLGSNPFIREFKIVDGPSVDGCGWTDGIDALAADLGPGLSNGVFICQDNNNTSPGSSGNQNFKFVPLERVVGLSGGGPPPAPGTVKMVVADPSALIAGEIAIRDRLMNSGYTVSIVDDNAVVASDAIGAAFVFVSSTVGDATLGAKLRDVPQPVWIAKPFSFDNMLMTGSVANVDYGNVSTDSVTITDTTHPLSAGLAGTVLVTPTNKTKSWGLPGPAADVVATAGGKPTTFAYQTGDQLVGGTTAPGCRLTSPAFQGGPTSFTAAAWAMFDAAATYAASNCDVQPPPDDALPTITLLSPTDGDTVVGDVAAVADASDVEGILHVQFFVDGISVGIDADGLDGWGLSWDSTTVPDGVVTLLVEVTDTAGQHASDSAVITVDNNSSPGTVKMVVADPSALIAGEIAIRDRLMNSGYTVSIVDDNAVVASDAIGAAFVFVSSTVGDATLGAKLRDVPQPVWIAKPFSFDNMLMTGSVANVDYGNVSTDSVTITDTTHPLSAGLAGTVLVTPTNKTKSWGLPGPAADVVATAGGKPTTFAYQTGDQLVGGTTAPGCRLTSPAFQGGPTSFTAAAWAMFDAAATYAASNCESLSG